MSQKKDNNYRTYDKYFIFLVLIAVAIFLLSSDKVGSALTVLAIMIAVLTAKIATNTLKLTDESLELTRNSFELTKKHSKGQK